MSLFLYRSFLKYWDSTLLELGVREWLAKGSYSVAMRFLKELLLVYVKNYDYILQ